MQSFTPVHLAVTQNSPYRGITSAGGNLTHIAGRQLEELYKLQADSLRGSLARKIGREDAEDIVGKAFVRLAEKLEVEPVKDGPAMLGTIIDGLLKNHYRDQDVRREREMPVGLSDDLALLAEKQLSGRGITQDEYSFQKTFDGALRDLDPEDREAFIVTELRGLTERDAADALGTSQKTVNRRAEAARTTLKKELIAA